MNQGRNFWVMGGEFGSMNFHKLVEGSAQVQGPFKTRKEAEDAWRAVSEENRHKAGARFSIVEEPSRGPAGQRCRRLRNVQGQKRSHPVIRVGPLSSLLPHPLRSRTKGVSLWEQTAFADCTVTDRLRTPP